MGEVIQLNEETAQYALGQRIVCLRGKDRALDNTFLRFLLSSPAQQSILASYATGTTVLGISQKALRSMPITFPRFSEQKKIGRLLAAIDDKIELNRRMNETLEAMARAIFKDWFVDFGPTRAKAEGRAPYLAANLWSLFPDRLDDEGKPDGWQLGTLEAVSDLNPESWGTNNKPTQLEYVDLTNTKWGTIESTEMYTWEYAPSRARRVLCQGDTIVGTVRPGNGSYALVDRKNLTGSTGFAVLRPKKGLFRELVYCAATSPDNIDRLAHLADGGAYPAVRPDLVADTELVISSPSIIGAFSSNCGPLIDRVEANRQESRTLAHTRDLLLPKLMSGEIRIRDVETEIGRKL